MKKTRKPTAKQIEASRAEVLLRLTTYPAAKAAAQARADATGMDVGLEWLGTYSGWVARGLPCKGSRFGSDRLVECVSCSDITKCFPGHGPSA